MKFKQHVVMSDLFLGHLVVHFRCVRIGLAQPVGEGPVDAVVLVFVRYRERQYFLFAEVGETFHGDFLGSLGLGYRNEAATEKSILELF